MLLCFLLYKLVRTTRPLGLRSVCVGVSVDSRRIVRLSASLTERRPRRFFAVRAFLRWFWADYGLHAFCGGRRTAARLC